MNLKDMWSCVVIVPQMREMLRDFEISRECNVLLLFTWCKPLQKSVNHHENWKNKLKKKCIKCDFMHNSYCKLFTLIES